MSRGAIIADLPLGAVGALDSEFGAVMACAGASLAPYTAPTLLSASFNFIIVAYHSETEGVGVRQILCPNLGEHGEWAPLAVSG